MCKELWGCRVTLGELRGQRLIHEAAQEARSAGKVQIVPRWLLDWHLVDYEADYGETLGKVSHLLTTE